ncbi:MAG: hypothetical protein JNN07_17405 [Verrucomicrobiales bacterium]|nr:hypothetical protein [Verrucomicrobiales bacterium]
MDPIVNHPRQVLKFLTTAAWIGLVLWTLVAVYLLSARSPGGDGAGRASGALMGLVSMPVLLIAAALLLWGSRGGPTAAAMVGSALVLIPITLALLITIKVNLPNSLRFTRAPDGRFYDPKLQELARAIDAGDAAGIQRLANDPALDRRQRDSLGRTILGHALARAADPSAGSAVQLDAVRWLLAAGDGKWDDTALAPDGQALARIVATSGDQATALAELALQHGAELNRPALSGSYPLIFDPVMDLARMQLFARHGANLHVLAPPSAGGIDGWTLLMCAVDRGRFALAAWLLEQGVNCQHVASDGESLETLLKGTSLFHSEAPAPTDPDERRFIEVLRPKLNPSR